MVRNTRQLAAAAASRGERNRARMCRDYGTMGASVLEGIMSAPACCLLSFALAVAAAGVQPSYAAPAPEEQMQAGVQAFQAGDFQEALRHWTTAAGAYEAAGNSEGRIRALMHSAEADLALGRNP